MTYEELKNKNLPDEVWALIQHGLNKVGLYSGTYKGRPGPKTKLALQRYLNQEENVEPSWLTIARDEIGIKEFDGAADNPRVVEYLKTVSLSAHAQTNDETAWCSAFANWCMKKASKNGTNKANARSWLKWGKKVIQPYPGAVTILWRKSPNSWQGHVGFYIRETTTKIYLLGGNQSDEVNIKAYSKSRLLAYREP